MAVVAAEHRVDGDPELNLGVLRELLSRVGDDPLEGRSERLEGPPFPFQKPRFPKYAALAGGPRASASPRNLRSISSAG
jgi:hypothetical protein